MIFQWHGHQKLIVTFHARFGALSRQYVYLIKCSSLRSALLKNFVTLTHKNLDPQLMAVAAQSLIGTYDFNAFRSAQCQAKTSVRSVTRLSVHHHDQLIAVHVEANGFLQHMVRNIVGVLMAIGAKERPTMLGRTCSCFKGSYRRWCDSLITWPLFSWANLL